MKKRNLKLFYIHESLFQFSDSMLMLVLPVFIYKTFNSISAVFIFVMLLSLIHGILFIPVFNLAMKWKKPKYFMMMGMIFYIISLALFSITNVNNKIIILPGLLFFALYTGFYWMIRHWFININTNHKIIGKQMSIASLIRTIIAFIAPIAGGIMSFIVSFNATFIMGMVAGTISLIPIALFHAPAHSKQYSFKKVWEIIHKKEVKAISPAYFWEGISSVTISYSWILIFSIFIGNIMDLGFLTGFTTLISGIIIWITGKHFDKKNRISLLNHITKLRTFTVSLFASIYFIPSIIYVWIIALTNKIILLSHYTILDSYLYAYGNKINPINFMLSREINLTISRFISAGILAILFAFLPEEFLWLVIFFGAFSVLGMHYIKKSDHYLN